MDKPWLCRKCRAGLGMVHWNGDGTPQLLLYRHAIDLSAVEPAEVDVIGPVMGKLPVRCDVCGGVQVWGPSAAVLLALLDEMTVEQLRQFVELFTRRWSERLEEER